MKKLSILVICIMGISLSGFASSSNILEKELMKRKKGAVVKKNQSTFRRQCFNVSFYLSCGNVWDGDVCVETNSNSLSAVQFQIAWNLANYAICGPDAEPWVD